jgi:DNA polymerase III delta subunit
VRAARALRDARVPREALASRLGVPPFKVQELMEASRSWSEGELEKAVAALGEADRRVKTGTDARAALLAAVVEATGKGAGATSTPSRR